MRRHFRTILVVLMLLAMLGAWMSVPSLNQISAHKKYEDLRAIFRQPPVTQLPPTATLTEPSKVASKAHGPAFTLLNSTPQEVRIQFALPDYSIKEISAPDGTIWHRITAQGTYSLDHAGAPALPVFRTNVALSTTRLANIEVIDAEYITIQDITPEPGIGPRLGTDAEPLSPTPDPTIYDNSAPYPAENLCLASHYQIRHTNGYGIVVAPFQYLPDRHELRIMTSARFAVRTMDEADEMPQLDAQSDFAIIQRKTYLNAEALRNAETPTVGTLQIVYPSKWRTQIQTALDSFVEWKRQIGWTVQVAGYPADTGEDADALKAYLQAQYDTTGFTHLVLIGDYNSIPPYQHQGTDEYGRNAEVASAKVSILYTLCASDVPYAFLDGTDDLLYQDAFLSRLPVSTYTHINSLLNRLRIFEQGTTLSSQSNPDWLTTGIFMGSGQASSTSTNPYYGIKDETIVAQAYDKLQEAGVITTATELYVSQGAPTADNVVEAINGGASVFYYLGHGSCSKFVTSGFASEDVNDLTNKLMLPFIIAPNCSSGNLEHGSSNDCSTHSSGEITTGSCLAQSFFDNQTNATIQAIIASTEVSFWTPPIVQLETFTDFQTQWCSTNHLTTNGAYATGSLNTAVEYCETFYDTYHSNYLNHNHALFEAWEMHLYGDASAVPRFGPQYPLNVSTTSTRDTGTIEVTVTGFGDSSPVPNAAVCLEVDGEYYSSRTDENGETIIQLPTVSTSSMTLRVLDASAPLFTQNVTFLPEGAVTATGATVSRLGNSTVVFTAILPDSASEADYEFSWTSEPELEFSGGGRIVSVPLNAIYACIWQGIPVAVACTATLRTYAVTAEGCTADREAAARGEAVNLAAVLPPDAEVADYDFAWSAVPEVEFTDNGITASFEMPAEPITVTCIMIYGTYVISTEGCVANKTNAACGAIVSLTAVLPPDAEVADYDFAWSAVPEVDFAADGATASFEMPAGPVAVACTAT
ncbi:MAG: hypothetical protein IKR13_02025, partial [Victivallales bacterium]|nr:hypothetical protein [Victivallales bacterium]